MALHFAVSWALMILIWLVQLIIYPGFLSVPSGGFVVYHRWYVKRIAFIVSPLMMAEALMTVRWLSVDREPAAVLSAVLVAVVWLSTLTLQVPVHNRLSQGKDDALIRRLVSTNWIRTAAWSVKTLVMTLVAGGRLLEGF